MISLKRPQGDSSRCFVCIIGEATCHFKSWHWASGNNPLLTTGKLLTFYSNCTFKQQIYTPIPGVGGDSHRHSLESHRLQPTTKVHKYIKCGVVIVMSQTTDLLRSELPALAGSTSPELQVETWDIVHANESSTRATAPPYYMSLPIAEQMLLVFSQRT
uniref:Uncharacterized protein n=1 Tax=Sphaerodactylus townsendi TaxID=933632 RepID=A0ACB8ESJ1_9SAUR